MIPLPDGSNGRCRYSSAISPIRPGASSPVTINPGQDRAFRIVARSRRDRVVSRPPGPREGSGQVGNKSAQGMSGTGRSSTSCKSLYYCTNQNCFGLLLTMEHKGKGGGQLRAELLNLIVYSIGH